MCLFFLLFHVSLYDYKLCILAYENCQEKKRMKIKKSLEKKVMWVWIAKLDRFYYLEILLWVCMWSLIPKPTPNLKTDPTHK